MGHCSAQAQKKKVQGFGHDPFPGKGCCKGYYKNVSRMWKGNWGDFQVWGGFSLCELLSSKKMML